MTCHNRTIFFKTRHIKTLLIGGKGYIKYLKGVKKVCSTIKLYSYYFSYKVSNDIIVTENLKSRYT